MTVISDASFCLCAVEEELTDLSVADIRRRYRCDRAKIACDECPSRINEEDE